MAALAAGGRGEWRGSPRAGVRFVVDGGDGRAGVGVALLPLRMFEQELAEGRLLQPFSTTLELGRYWLTRLRSRAEREPAKRFREWLQAQAR
jgi:DNA-binding transcriptional LysR family regulator